MPNTQTTEDSLKAFGLTPYETKCYLALLQRGTLTVPEISTIAGVPRSNAYDALEKMMSKGMCISKPGNTKRYSASPPDLLRGRFLMKLDEETESELEKFKRDQSRALKEKEKEMLERKKAAEADITRVMTTLQPEYEESQKQTDPLDYIEIIKDPYQISKRFMQLVEATKEELLGFIKPPYSATKETIIEQIKQQIRLIKEGLKIRAVWEIPKDKEMIRWLDAYLREAAKYGDQMRVIEELPLKMAIFDSRIVIFTLEDPVSGEISVTTQIVEHRALARTLKLTFETLWEQARDYQTLGDSRR